MVVVVSEERGTISYCFNGNIVTNIDGSVLRQTLIDLLEDGRKKAGSDEEKAVVSATKSNVSGSGPRSEPPRELARESIAPTQTPLPTVRKSVRAERLKLEAVRSAGIETPRAKMSVMPMPKGGPKAEDEREDEDDGEDENPPLGSRQRAALAATEDP